MLEEVEGVLGSCGEHRSERFLLGDVGAGDDVGRQRGVYRFYILLAGPAHQFQYLFDLVERRISWEYGFTVDELAQNAADGPHVHSLGVFGGAQEDFRSSVPPGGHILGENLLSDLLGTAQRPRQSEVCDLGVALGVEEEVAGFEIAVDEFSGVHILEGLEELVDDEFLMYFLENAGADDDVEIYVGEGGTCFHEVEDEVEIFVIFGLDDVEQADYIFVSWVGESIPLSSCRNMTYRKVRCASVALWKASNTYILAPIVPSSEPLLA